MSAARLREAAETLRERAADESFTNERVMPTAVHINSATYMVLSPRLALDLARLLDAEASVIDRDENERKRRGTYAQPRLLVGTEDASLMVAKAILGDRT